MKKKQIMINEFENFEGIYICCGRHFSEAGKILL
jgi:hypothetical protein